MSYAHNAYIGMTFQNSFGTARTSGMVYVPFVSENLTLNYENVESSTIKSRFDAYEKYTGAMRIEGDIQMEVHPVIIGYFLKAWFGNYMSSGTAPKNHIFAPTQTDWLEGACALPPLTFVVYTGVGSAHVFYDCLVNQLTFTAAHNALYQCNVSIIGGQHTYTAKTNATFLTGSFYNFNTCSLSLGGTAWDNVSQLEIALNNNLEGKYSLNGKNTYSRILRGSSPRTVEISGTQLLNSPAQFAAYKNRTIQNFTAAWTIPASTAAQTTNISFQVPGFQYSEFPETIEGPGVTEVSFKAQGLFDPNMDFSIMANITNTYSGY